MLTLSFITGTQPGKWFERFRERTSHGGLETLDSDDALAEVLAGRADLALTRLPDARVDARFHVVELYTEAPGVAFPRDSHLAAAEGTLEPADLEGEIINWRLPENREVDAAAVRDALQIVAANVGVVIAPRPLLKVLSRKQIEHRELAGGASTTIALVWPCEGDSEEIQDFVGIARGRTVNSSRQATPKRSAREKTLARQSRRQAEQPGQAKPRRRPGKRR